MPAVSAVVDINSSPEFEALLAPRPPAIAALTRRLVSLIAAYPGLEARVMPGWGSVNFRHSRAGHVCGVFPSADGVALYFEHGRLLHDPDGLLEGKDLKRGRMLRLRPDAEVPVGPIGAFLAEAIALFA
ncbi:DUF1801 domain-containing protein [Devosia albogilva]|uniref:DUF1801 domain-containing protein n=1 Tax=Devosia albogilva TaxID=429726 RepID=A0ABW5QJS0_9HYPH